MKTIILPGYSVWNKTWAEETRKELEKLGGCEVVYWPHWESGKSEEGWIEKEAEKIVNNNKEKINVIAKSIGTIVLMALLKRNKSLVDKMVICGIPISDFNLGDENYYNVLKEVPAENILCIQNVHDNHGTFEEAKKLIAGINPEIKVTSKPRDDHEYFYGEDFEGFLGSL